MKDIKCIERRRRSLAVSLVFFVFGVMFAAIALAGLFTVILDAAGIIEFWDNERLENIDIKPFRFIFNMLAFSVFIGMAITAFFSKKALKPIRNLITATRKVSKGDFNVQVNENVGIGELWELSRSFNKMTQELSSIETLRSDFINTFSHEFKTPIVSLRGFAKLLKDNNLPEYERQEYLDIIISESERLSGLATNVLNLTKYQNIEIVANKEPFRLDEQIRRAVVLLEPKWSVKDINVNLDMGEITYNGNEDLMQQVWVNLIDNAVKFSETGGMIKIRLMKWNNGVRFVIEDNGGGFDEDVSSKIFEKFYQSDSSRTKVGNGLGLAIVKRIMELCGGTIEVKSEQGKGSRFTVFLPM